MVLLQHTATAHLARTSRGTKKEQLHRHDVHVIINYATRVRKTVEPYRLLMRVPHCQKAKGTGEKKKVTRSSVTGAQFKLNLGLPIKQLTQMIQHLSNHRNAAATSGSTLKMERGV
eukprot:866444-Pelagomonas_calceolata.AAC.3